MANPIENKQLAEALNEINTLGKSIEATFKGISEQAKKVGANTEDLAKNLDFSKSTDIKVVDQLLQDLTKRVDDLTQALKGRDEATEELTKQEKTLLKLQKQQAESTDELAVSIEEVRLERSKSTKAAKEQAKENKGLTLTLDKQRKELNRLQRELTNAAIEGRLNEESVKAQKEEFEKLFTAVTEAEQQFGNFRRQVGNYEKASDSINKTLKDQKKRFSELGEEIKNSILEGSKNEDQLDELKSQYSQLGKSINFAESELSKINQSIKGVEKDFGKAEKSVEKLEKSLRQVRNATIAVGAVAGAGGLVGRSLKSGEDSFDDLRVATDAVDTAINTLLAGTVKGLVEGFEDAKNSVTSLGQLYDVITGALSGLVKEAKNLDKVIETQSSLTEATIKFEKSLSDAKDGSSGLLTTLADQVEAFEILTAQAERNSLSLEERIVLIDKAAKASEAAFATDKKIASDRVAIFEQALANAVENGVRTQEIQKELTQARLDLNEVESGAAQQEIQNAEIKSQLLSDQKELELDILIDSFDTQKTINERIIADTSQSFEKRQSLLDETTKKAEISFEAQKQVVLELLEIEGRDVDAKDQTNRGKELNEALTKTVGLSGKLKLNQEAIVQIQTAANELQKSGLADAKGVENINKLIEKNQQGQVLNAEEIQILSLFRKNLTGEIVKEESNQLSIRDKLNQFIKADILDQVKLREELGVSEKISTRVLEISREKRILDQDIVEAQQDLVDSSNEFIKTQLDVVDQEAALQSLRETGFGKSKKANETLDKLEKERVENQVIILELQLSQAEEGSEEQIKIQKELNDVLLGLEKDRISEEEDLQKEALEAVANGAEFISDQLTRLSEARVQNIENEIDALSRTEERLRDDIKNGSELGEESLTNLQEKRDAKALEREEELKKQARLELLVAGAQLLAQSGSFQEASGDIVKLGALIKTLLGFHDGGYTGDGGEWSTAGVVHKGEFVNTAKQVDNYGMKGWNASDFDKAVQNGYFTQFSENVSSDYLNNPVEIARPSTSDNPRLINAVQQVTQAVLKSIDDKPRHDKNWIEEAKEMEYKLKTKTRIENERIKSFRY